MTSPVSHICPKCHEPRNEADFRRKDGKLAGWCEECRVTYRDRLTRLRDSKKLIKRGIQEMATDLVAQAEGYANHPLATLLALSHIAGAKRALAIRDGKSWRGKKAWGEYYRAQRELAKLLEPQHPVMTMTLPAGYHWRVYGGDPANPVFDEKLTKLVNDQLAERDPNSEPVSSEKEEEKLNG